MCSVKVDLEVQQVGLKSDGTMGHLESPGDKQRRDDGRRNKPQDTFSRPRICKPVIWPV